MPRKGSRHLTEGELRLMQVLWEKGTATVSEVVEAVAETTKGAPPAYSTILTTLRILERKGYVRHTKESRAFIYHPVVHRDKATETAIAHLLHRFFDNSVEQLVLNLMERKKIDSETIRRLRKRIEEKKS
jgi:predicted transcriptional regulator